MIRCVIIANRSSNSDLISVDTNANIITITLTGDNIDATAAADETKYTISGADIEATGATYDNSSKTVTLTVAAKSSADFSGISAETALSVKVDGTVFGGTSSTDDKTATGATIAPAASGNSASASGAVKLTSDKTAVDTNANTITITLTGDNIDATAAADKTKYTISGADIEATGATYDNSTKTVTLTVAANSSADFSGISAETALSVKVDGTVFSGTSSTDDKTAAGATIAPAGDGKFQVEVGVTQPSTGDTEVTGDIPADIVSADNIAAAKKNNGNVLEINATTDLFGAATVKSAAITLKQAAVDALKGDADIVAEIATNFGTVSISSKALTEILNANTSANGKDIQLVTKDSDKTASQLPAGATDAIFEVTLECNGTPLTVANLTNSIPLKFNITGTTLTKPWLYRDNNGTAVPLKNCIYNASTGELSGETDHLSIIYVAEKATTPAVDLKPVWQNGTTAPTVTGQTGTLYYAVIGTDPSKTLRTWNDSMSKTDVETALTTLAGSAVTLNSAFTSVVTDADGAQKGKYLVVVALKTVDGNDVVAGAGCCMIVPSTLTVTVDIGTETAGGAGKVRGISLTGTISGGKYFLVVQVTDTATGKSMMEMISVADGTYTSKEVATISYDEFASGASIRVWVAEGMPNLYDKTQPMVDFIGYKEA